MQRVPGFTAVLFAAALGSYLLSCSSTGGPNAGGRDGAAFGSGGSGGGTTAVHRSGGNAAGGNTGVGGSGGQAGDGAATGGAFAGGGGGQGSGGVGAGGQGAGGAATGGSGPSKSDASAGGQGTGGSATGGTGAGGAGSGGSGTAKGGAGGNDAGSATGGVTGTGGAGTGGAGTGGTGAGGTQANLPAGVTALFPPPEGQGICPDPPLRITFSGAPTLGTAGKIQVYGSSGTAVASVDLAASTVTDTIGGTSFIMLRPVYVDGNDVVIYLKTKALAYGQTYYVTVDSGAIKPPGGGTLAITGSTAWRFSTAAAAPSNLSALSVALDGSGQFCTVQGATDALPANNTAASTITIKSGTYHEIMHVSKKSNITLHGQDRKQTILLGTNNNTQQTGNSPGTSNRALLGFDSTNGLTIENLTIHNLTPQDGSQAEALRLQNCDKCIVRDADILSLQDTLLWSGRIYADNCLIAGNVDYIWGTGVAYFNKCEIRTVGRSGVLVQSRNAAGAYGYVFVDSKLTTDSVSNNNMLARIDVSVYPGSHVAYLNCQMTNIAAAGWTVTGGTPTSSLRFWEYQSTDASGNALGTSGRQYGTQISATQAASMRDPTVVLGGWQP
jgi:pectin methylesterase-like acyl-CoA thioesterase